MYDSDRVRWWVDRSSSPEYQHAYDSAARNIPEGGTLLELGCGTGELLKRLRQNYDRLIGTDSSKEMIDLAKQNLKGLDVKLIRDNIIVSSLKPEISDVTLLAFPEIIFIGGFSRDEEIFNRKLIRKFEEKFAGRISKKYENFILARLRSNFILGKITKKGGYVVKVVYDISESEGKDRRRLKKLGSAYELSGLKLKKSRFFEDPRIIQDTYNLPEVESEFPRARKGYRILTFKKVR